MKSHSPYVSPECADRLHRRVSVTSDFPKPGVLFRDVSGLLADELAFYRIIETMCAPYREGGAVAVPSHVAGIESRGFIFGAAMARCFGCGFLMLRKAGKLPPPTDRVAYSLEYGEAALELPRGALRAGDRVAVVDDLLATGGTAAAAAALVRGQGAQVVGFDFAIALGDLGGEAALADVARVHAVLTY